MKTITIFFFCACYTQGIFTQTYVSETVVLSLQSPVAFDFLPDTNVIVTSKNGPVRIYSLNNTLVSQFWNFSDSCFSMGEMGVLGVVIDPSFSVNHFVYIFYTSGTPAVTHSLRVIRFTENNNTGTNPFMVLEVIDSVLFGNTHAGGNMRFGPDGKLYVSIGSRNSGGPQSLSSPFGKILRINSNGTIPADNPFYDNGNPYTGNDDRIWALGLRNTFDLCFSPVNDSLYATENGDNIDEVNFIRRGKNYAFPYCQGFCVPYNPLYRQPMAVWTAPDIAPTGVIIYSGDKMPELNNRLLVAGSNTGTSIQNCVLGNAPFYDTVVSRTDLIPLSILTTLAQGPDGYIYALRLNGSLNRIRHSSIGITGNSVPVSFSLEQNYPNPFNPVTTISYSITRTAFVTLKVFDVLGREIAVLVDGKKIPGSYETYWEPGNNAGGVYFYRLNVEGHSLQKKMILLK